ncbi:unnamed protein product [Nippostrongylus brasiliensis]|uniref:Sulfate_transp domain-containing protein n=1 Tax=Nippostrongylus brasiliensis TaxID=27835 RepID=A0A0N4YFX8_NIPBR|nr:unnamed protein product [Nippostrongylus brasiliensis]
MAHCQPTTMERPPMNQEEFDRRFEYELPQKKKSVFTRFTSVSKKYWQPFTSPRNFGRTIVSFLPIIHWLPRPWIQVFVGTFGLDFVMTYFSDELVAGFTTGASFHIFVTQVKDVVGIPNLPRRTGIGNCVMVGLSLFFVFF